MTNNFHNTMVPTNYLLIEAVKIIEEPFKNKDKKPRFINLKDSDIWWVDLPRRKDLYHGTTFSIRCRDKQCSFRGVYSPTSREYNGYYPWKGRAEKGISYPL